MAETPVSSSTSGPASSGPRGALFSQLGRSCHDRRWFVIIAWIVFLVVGNGVLAAVGGASTDADFSLPDVESKRGTDILEDSFGGQGAGFGGSIVFRAEDGVDDAAVQEGMEALFADVAKIDGIARLGSPYAEGGERQISTQGADAGNIAYAQIDVDPNLDENDFLDTAKRTRDAVDAVDIPGVQIELGGAAFAEFAPPNSELLGVAFAIVILILAFGSVIAMGLPIGVALAGIGAGTAVAGFLSFIIHPPSFASIFGLMIGLGVGIDYALFLVTRYRENRHRGLDTCAAVGNAIDTAGRAVLFAGTTVVISVLGMVLMGLSFVTGMAVAIATVVAFTMIASLTLLPALLGFIGGNVEVTRRRGLIAAALVAVALVGAGLEIPGLILLGIGPAVVVIIASFFAEPLRAEVRHRPPKPLRETFAYRWSRLIQRRPWPAALLAVAVLLFLAIPVTSLRLTFSDEGNYADDTTTRKAYDMLAEGFGPGYNGALVVVAELPPGVEQSALERVGQAIGEDDGVASVGPPVTNEPDNDAVLWEVIPNTAPQDEETTDLVDRLRADVVPSAVEGTDLDPSVAGTVAINADFAHYLSERLVLFFAAVLFLSFVLLMVVFRSLLVPLKAVIMNLLSIGAAYGVIVAGFQWGWFGGILNFDEAPIEPWIPMMLFAIVFGLSMDYEVFLLSRVKEEYDRTGDSHTSVADGLAATARVITAAALIMVFVFGAFLLEPDRIVKLMGVGLATAVLLDATIVRMLLVPATMELLGDRNWWMPGWLGRILPKIDVEGGHEIAPVEAPHAEPEPAERT